MGVTWAVDRTNAMFFPLPGGTAMSTDRRAESRRSFLRFLAQSPLLYGLTGTLAATAARAQDDAVLSGALAFKDVIKSVDEALNVWDFEAAMRARVNAGHYAYMAQGADDFGTIAANRAGFTKIKLRPQRLVDVSKIDMTTEIFARRWPLRYFCAPSAHRRCSIPTARWPLHAARSRKTWYRRCRP